jgi:hypothetical protein
VLDTELQARFARSCTDAAIGYARAATAVYASVAMQTFEFWANAASSSSRGAPPFGARGARSAIDGAPMMSVPFGFWQSQAIDIFKLANPWAQQGAGSAAAQFAFSPVAAWWAMFPLNGNPASWPMAYGLMTAGVPSSIAWPTAEANAAAIDAAEAASDALDAAFATYRTESGFAVAPFMTPRRMVAAMLLAPLGASLALPWVMATRVSGF